MHPRGLLRGLTVALPVEVTGMNQSATRDSIRASCYSPVRRSFRTRFPSYDSTRFVAVLFLFCAVGCGTEADDPLRPSSDSMPGFPDRTTGDFGLAADPPAPIGGGDEWYVAVDGSGDFPTIQAAINGAHPGDTIVLGPGRYTWTEQGTSTGYGMVFLNVDRQDIELRSESGPEETILDAESQGRHMYFLAHNHGFRMQGLTFENGNAIGQDLGVQKGGAIVLHATAPVIRDCVFRNNIAVWGGAIVLAGSCAPFVLDCRFEGNIATQRGGAVFLMQSVRWSYWKNCDFRGNTASLTGGAIAASHSWFHLIDSAMYANFADGSGAALDIRDSLFHLTGNTIAANVSPGVSGVNVRWFSTGSIASTILAFGSGPGLGLSDSELSVGCTDLFGNEFESTLPAGCVDLGGNIYVDPQFVDLEGGDLRLRPGSPCLPTTESEPSGCARIGAFGEEFDEP